MNIFQLKLFYGSPKSAVLKTIVFLILLLFCFDNLSAQKEGNVKVKIETGFLWDWVYGKIYLSGPFLNVEPQLKTSKNTCIGLRLGAAFNSQAIKNADPRQFYIDKNFNSGNKALSLIPTFNYYFSKNKRRPYLSLGIGYYFLTTSKKVFVLGKFVDALGLSVNNQIGFLLRGGFDLHRFMVRRFGLNKFTIGLEVNYIPKAAIEVPNGPIIGSINNSNIALAIGYKIGNRERSK